MTPLTVFFRTLLKTSAIFLGVTVVFLHPSLTWPSSRGVTAQQSPAEGAVDGLVAALKDADAGVRRQAAAALGELGSARAVPGLIDALKDSDPGVRQRAIASLAEIGDPRAAAGLAAALKDASADIRARAASALGELQDAAAVEPLIAAARDTNVDVRRRSAIALGEIADQRALDVLTALMKDADAGVRRAAVRAIAEISGGGAGTTCRCAGHIPIRIRTSIPIQSESESQPESEIQIQIRGHQARPCGSAERGQVCRGVTARLAVALTTPIGAQSRGVRDLVTALSASDPAARARAACELRELGDAAADALQPLVNLLADAAPVDGNVCRNGSWHGSDPTTPRRAGGSRAGCPRQPRLRSGAGRVAQPRLGGAPQRRVGTRRNERSARRPGVDRRARRP